MIQYEKWNNIKNYGMIINSTQELAEIYHLQWSRSKQKNVCYCTYEPLILGKAITKAKRHEPMLYEAPKVISGLLLNIACAMMRGPNKSLKH